MDTAELAGVGEQFPGYTGTRKRQGGGTDVIESVPPP